MHSVFLYFVNMQYQYIDKKENMHIGNGFEFCFSSISFFCIERRNDPVYVWDNPNTRFLYVIYYIWHAVGLSRELRLFNTIYKGFHYTIYTDDMESGKEFQQY